MRTILRIKVTRQACISLLMLPDIWKDVRKGDRKKRLKMVLLMKQEGESVDRIMKYTQLSREEIEQI